MTFRGIVLAVLLCSIRNGARACDHGQYPREHCEPQFGCSCDHATETPKAPTPHHHYRQHRTERHSPRSTIQHHYRHHCPPFHAVSTLVSQRRADRTYRRRVDDDADPHPHPHRSIDRRLKNGLPSNLATDGRQRLLAACKTLASQTKLHHHNLRRSSVPPADRFFLRDVRDCRPSLCRTARPCV